MVSHFTDKTTEGQKKKFTRDWCSMNPDPLQRLFTLKPHLYSKTHFTEWVYRSLLFGLTSLSLITLFQAWRRAQGQAAIGSGKGTSAPCWLIGAVPPATAQEESKATLCPF